MEGFRKKDPPTKKKLLVEIDVQEFLAYMGMEEDATEMVKAVGYCAVIVFYFLMQVGEYTAKKKETKQRNGAVQFGRYNVFLSGC